MRRRTTKIAAVLLSAVIVLQGGAGNAASDSLQKVYAAEQMTEEAVQTQAAKEVQTQAATEVQTQAVTEAQTQAATEAQTQAVTEAQTQAATEVQTQAATEAQTQAVTEAQTQAVTEAQTQAATEAQTQAVTEAQTQTDIEETKQTEQSERVNAGSKIKRSKLTAALKKVLPYLFAAETVTISEKWTEEAEHILQGENGAAAVSGLKNFSLELADAKSSSEVEVFNLYADQNGRLDTTQLDKVYPDGIIDVTKRYVVINVIANTAGQDLNFSGYDMVLSDKKVQYTEDTQPGDILYNFAAIDGEKLTAYKGTLTLAGNLQGTFLAPEAEVRVDTDLAGAVYAETIKVADSVEELLHIVFSEGKSAETALESEAETETETAKVNETVTEISIETETVSEEGKEELVELLLEDEVQQVQPIALTPLTEDEDKKDTSLVITVVDGEGNVVPSAIFVVKDQNKKVLTENGQPLYYVSYTGTATNPEMVLNLEKLVAGIQDTDSHTYYLSQLRTEQGYQIDTQDHAFMVTSGTVYFETSEGSDSVEYSRNLTITNEKLVQDAQHGTLTVTGKTYYQNVLLTDEQENTRYVALFADEELTIRVSAVLPLRYEKGKTETGSVEFAELASKQGAASYYLAQTDEFGTVIPTLQEEVLAQAEGETVSEESPDYQIWIGDAADNQIEFPQLTDEQPSCEAKQAHIDFYLDHTEYNENSGYSYQADLTVTKKVFDVSGAALSSEETFYFNVFAVEKGKAELGKAVFDQPQAITMNKTAEASATVQLKLYAASSMFAIREVDKNGTLLTSDIQDFAYAISYSENPDGTFAVVCSSSVDEKGQFTGVTVPTKLTIENRKTDSIVKLQAEDQTTGKLLTGISLVIKNKAGQIVLVNNKKVLTSAAEPIELKNLLTAGETYYLSALQAPNGYASVPDLAFTVSKSGETLVSLQYSPVKSTDYKLTLTKQVYSGKYQVYAYDTSTGDYAAEGAYTFYAALFADEGRTQKVSDVQKITVTGLSGTTVFKNLEKDQTYYVGETDEYGQLKKSTSALTVKYASKGVVTMSEKSKTSIIQNAYTSLPNGYRYTGTLTIAKKVTDTSGNAASVNESFYAGIYRQADYSDKPTVVKLNLSNVSSASVKKRILLSGSSDMVYYIAEVDADGKRITDDSDFAYVVSIDQPTATVSKGTNTTVTITNQAKATKATLYLTKKVYNGAEQMAVNETFYAGLFKDAAFTKPYTKPIAMKLENKSELTLKLSLNLGTASSTKIYIAEVDADGNVIKDEQSFGYQIRMVNSTVEFTQERREIQTIILNSKYGTTSSNDWNEILDKDGNDLDSMNDGYWGISGNGDISDSTAAQTGDDTPILFYGVLMGLALVVLIVLLVLFRKKRDK